VVDVRGGRQSVKDINVGIIKQKSAQYEDGVGKFCVVTIGDVEVKPSFGIGLAKKDAKPTNKLELSQSHGFFNTPVSDGEEEKKITKETEIKSVTKIDSSDIPDKNTAFQIFKSEYTPVKDFEQDMLSTSENLKKCKEDAKEYLNSCNIVKEKIEALKNFLNDKKVAKYNEGVSIGSNCLGRPGKHNR
jgi:hypothetical protein